MCGLPKSFGAGTLRRDTFSSVLGSFVPLSHTLQQAYKASYDLPRGQLPKSGRSLEPEDPPRSRLALYSACCPWFHRRLPAPARRGPLPASRKAPQKREGPARGLRAKAGYPAKDGPQRKPAEQRTWPPKKGVDLVLPIGMSLLLMSPHHI